MSSFGRKGLISGSSAPAEHRGFGHAPAKPGLSRQAQFAAEPDLDAQREAFVASERARQARETGEISEVAERFSGFAGTIRIERNLTVAYTLCLLLGTLSAHRVYLGAYQTALVQFLLGAFAWMLVVAAFMSGALEFSAAGLAVFAACGFWLLADLFLIPRIFAKLCRGSGESPFASA